MQADQLGIHTEQGTVLRPVPRQIRITSPNSHEEVFLDIHLGDSFVILIGVHAGERVQTGDYLGVGNLYRSRSWLLRNPTKWMAVK